VAIVWPCPLPVDAYVAAGREVEVPRPVCPSCAGPLVFWSGYWRHVRAAGRCRKIFVPRLRCGPCRVSHALLPAFTLAWRLDVAETVGAVIAQVAGGGCGVRPAAARAGVPYTTARGWVRRFRARAPELGTGFAALAVELGGEAICPAAEAGRFALAAVGAAFAAAAGLPGWLELGAWRFAASVSGGTLIAANTGSPFLVVGKRRFMPPVPPAPP
jgi:transposase-like protein